MLGRILTSHYAVENDKAQVYLYGRLETGESFCVTQNAKPYFFIRQSDTEAAKKLLDAEFENTQLKTLQREVVSQVTISNPKEVPILRKTLEDNNIPCYEADIPFTTRFLIDTNIFTGVSITGDAKKGSFGGKLFENATLTASTAEHNFEVLSFDIETTQDTELILSIALKQGEYEEVLVLDGAQLKDVDFAPMTKASSEEELLELFFSRIQEHDPDIITGWNVIDFDLAVIARRAKHYNIPFVLGRDNKTTNLRIEQSYFRDSKVYCHGRIVLDGIHLLKSNFVKLDDYKLNTAAKEFLDDSKLIEEDDRFSIIHDAYKHNPKLFLEYNLKDADLVLRILEASGILELTLQRSQLTGMHPDRVKASIASFDSLYLRELRKAGYVAPTTRAQSRDEGIGGFVMSSKPGLYTNVLVLDFKSLYPSIMRTFNLDPVSYLGTTDDFSTEELTQKDKYIVAPNHAVIANNKGILPELLWSLWQERDKAAQAGNKLARYAIKILMNSLYGVLASPNSRFHNRKLSNAITSFGQFFIKLTAEHLREQGYDVIYGDTDSVFVDVKSEDKEESKKIGKAIEKELNTFMEQYVAENYNRESQLQLEFEKHFLNFFMPTVRGKTSGAKKRYAGLRERDDGSTYLDVTGLEIVRSDWTDLAKEFQEQLLLKVFASEPIEDIIKSFVENLQAGKYDDLLIYRKSLRKSLDKYTKTTPPHVKAARLLDEVKSTVISYYITKEGPQPQEKLTAPIDYDHYVEKQLKPIATSLLEVMGKDFEMIIKGTSQKGLGDFM